MQLDDAARPPYGKLSAGQKTRVSLAKALLNEPELLLLDEPTASLDPDTADWVRAKLETYCRDRGATIVLASHNMAEVERLADRVIMLESGRIIADEPAAADQALRPANVWRRCSCHCPAADGAEPRAMMHSEEVPAPRRSPPPRPRRRQHRDRAFFP